MGVLIAIDGVDSSGKQTQTELLYERLINDGYKVKKISFPDYESDSSALVKMYLSGDFGENPEDVNAYQASSFFAADRFASYRMNWKKDYEDGVIILADRYVSSNMIHQASKIDDINEKNKFIEWLYDFEFNLYQIPKPDITFFLDMPVEYAKMLMENRKNKFDSEAVKDIHERNTYYLEKSYKNACMVAKINSWHKVCCINDNAVRTVEDINNELYNAAVAKIKTLMQ